MRYIALIRLLVALAPCVLVAAAAAPVHAHPADSAVDKDHDNVRDTEDNCPPPVTNDDQADTDRDGQGDACDFDDDGDGVEDGADNCSRASNADQTDRDGDGAGDPCDADDDGDGLTDSRDNCASAPNPGQEDADGDGIGDACANAPDAGPRAEPGASGGGGAATGGGGATRTGPTVQSPDPLEATLAVPGDPGIGDLAAGGLTLAFGCSRACAMGVTFEVAPATARRLGLRSGAALAEAGWRLGARGRTYLFLVPAPAVARRLRRLGSLTGTLRVVVSDADGRSSRVTQPLRLFR